MAFKQLAVERVVDPDHPTLAGHFPWFPVLPAVVILEEISAVIVEHLPGVQVRGFPIVKLLRPLRPYDRFTIKIWSLTDERLKLRCVHKGNVIALGEIDVSDLPTTLE
jgi:3-hydroxymyristoyl/3-hydroxydecanoyl-(acyl carrier protein) dehydratase